MYDKPCIRYSCLLNRWLIDCMLIHNLSIRHLLYESYYLDNY
ncbi:hypothetical protein CPT_Privateer_145 [Proteus phage Privateer]|uniref:Uncharacterized protein n=1 Tax=Proteus phage Privateer TaxID=2712958 RepID=A0A6G8R401_9CAUD|nr:hypothetical protein HWD17_gp111 [Proteus phage Privateer]QIN94935.1 hypothetical protein CPT_Privateer_145 [Proteus phage Privateer]